MAEGTKGEQGYRTTFGYGQPLDVNAPHPGRVNKSGGYASDASGRYQFLSTTWKGVNGGKNVPMTPENQDRAALELMRRRGVDPERDTLTPENVAKLAPEWASLPTLEGKSYYGQPVKKFWELPQAWGSSSGSPRAATTGKPAPVPAPALAGVEELRSSNPLTAVALAGLGGGASAPAKFAQGAEFADELGKLAGLFDEGEGSTPPPAAPQINGQQQPASRKQDAPPLLDPGSLGAAAIQVLNGRVEPAPAPEQLGPAASTGGGMRAAEPTPRPQPPASGGGFEKPESITFDSGQPGIDLWFKSKQFPALLGGTVKDIGRQGGPGKGYGNYVVVEGQDPLSGKSVDALYAHLADDGINVRVGDQVQPGQTIGTQGGTGRVVSSDGTIASFDLLAPAPKGSGSMVPFSNFDPLRRHLAQQLGHR